MEKAPDTLARKQSPAAGDEEKAKPTGAANPDFVTVQLEQPLKRGEQTIESLRLRKPKSGELRGLTLADVIQTDISTLLKLIPRISEPSLSDEECSNLDTIDLVEIGGAIRGFFMTRAERKMMETMLADFPSTP